MIGNKVVFDRDELDLITALAGCSLDEKPGSNWVQDSGGLPEYICEIARAIKRSGGKSTSQAISIAVSRVKKWASGVGVDKDTQAKAAKALAEWEKLKAKSKAKSGVKKAGHTLAATNRDVDVLALTDYNMDDVRSAFNKRNNEIRKEWRKANPNASYEDGPAYLYVKEVWNTFLIVQSDYGRDADLYKVPYTVDHNNDITFGDAVEVKTEYVVVDEGSTDDPGGDLTDETLKKLVQMSAVASKSALDKIVRLAAG